MPDNLGPGSYSSTQLAIDLLISEMNDLELQRLQNSTTQQLVHKHSSAEISDIQAKYSSEIQLVKNEMGNCEDKTNNEYKELMQEVEELEDERDSKIKQIETEGNIKDEYYDSQNVTLEAQYEAAEADKKGLEEAQEQDIKRQ